MKILVLDDDEILARNLARTLDANGHHVIAEHDPDVALELLRAGESFDLVLCDRRMPTMYGEDFVDEVRALRGGDTPVLALMVDQGDAATGSADCTIAKPLRAGELRGLVAVTQNVKTLRTHAMTQRLTRLVMVAS